MAALPEEHIKVHDAPRITANELARYMLAGDVGRKGIIKRAREVSTSVVVRYSDARNTLKAAICDPVNKKKIVFAARDAFEQKSEDTSQSSWTREDSAKSIDVMDAFIGMENQLAGFDFVPAPTSQDYLILGGVSVSVTCDFLTHRKIKGVDCIGGGLFRLTKPEEDESAAAKTKREDMGAYAATLVYMQIAQNLSGSRQPRPDLCWSVDVQCGDVHKAPKQVKGRVNKLEAACEFIAAMWDKV